MRALSVTRQCADDEHAACDGDAWTAPGVEAMPCMCGCHETRQALAAQLGEVIDLAYELSDGTAAGAAAVLRETFSEVAAEHRIIEDVFDDDVPIENVVDDL